MVCVLGACGPKVLNTAANKDENAAERLVYHEELRKEVKS